MQTTRPRITWKVLPMAQVAIFKEIFDQVRKDLDCELFYSELKRHNVSHYIYYLATDNIHIVLENDNTVLIKGLKKVVNVKFSRNTHLIIETSYDRLKSREITFQQYRENLAKAGVFRWVTNIHEHKRYYYTFDNSLLFTERPEHHTNLSTLNHNVRFLPCQSAWGVGIMQYVYALNPVCIVLIIPGHSRREVLSGAMDIVNPGIQ